MTRKKARRKRRRREEARAPRAEGAEPGRPSPAQPPPLAASPGAFPASWPRTWLATVVAVLLGMHLALAVTSVRKKSPTYDEPLHFTMGYVYWETGDFRMAAASPPLAALWAALPPFAIPARLPSFDSTAWRESNHFIFGPQFFYGMNNPTGRMLHRGRTMIAVLSVLLGLTVFFCSQRLFGDTGGVLTLLLYAFSPTLLAHARLVTADLTMAAFFFFATLGPWWAYHRLTPWSALVSALALAGLFLSKMSAYFILPVLLGLLTIRVFSRTPLELNLFSGRRVITTRSGKVAALGTLTLAQAAAVYIAIWCAYGFRYYPFSYRVTGTETLLIAHEQDAGRDPWEVQLRGYPRLERVINFARQRRLLPEIYLYAIAFGVQSATVRSSFLDGSYSLTGFASFFPKCFLYKTPLSLMALLACALCAAWWYRGRERAPPRGTGASLDRALYRTAPLWLLLVTYAIGVLPSRLNIGHRHILPIYPPLFVLAGAAAGLLAHPVTLIRFIVPALAAVFISTSLWIYPHYLAYFNWIAGGPANGYRHLVDSSLDWGQDLIGLKEWLDGHAGNEHVFLAYFGNAPPRHYGVQAIALPYETMGYAGRRSLGSAVLTPGIYCISATQLQQVYPPGLREWTDELEREYRALLPPMRRFEDIPPTDEEALLTRVSARGDAFVQSFIRFQRLRFARLCDYLRQREPDAHVGFSILIYRLTSDELQEALFRRP